MKRLWVVLLMMAVVGVVDGQSVRDPFVCFSPVRQMPEFMGGPQALLQYLSENVDYPKKYIEDSIQGKVVISFVIDEKGCITRPMVVRSVHPLLDKEVLWVVKRMPRWKPGTLNGKLIKVKYCIPIRFKLTSLEDNKQDKMSFLL